MSTTKNIIRKQIIDLQFNGNVEAFPLQKQVSEWCKDKLVPAIEMALEGLGQGEDYIKIDKISIDTSIIDPTVWGDALLIDIIEQLTSEISATVNIQQPTAAAQRTSGEAGFRDLLFYFLQNGFLPWWSTINSKPDFSKRLEEWLINSPQTSADSLFHLLQHPAVQKRIATQFSDKAFAYYIAGSVKIPPHNAEAIVSDVFEIQHAFFSNTNIISKDFSSILFNKQLNSPVQNVLINTIREWLQNLAGTDNLNVAKLQSASLKSTEFRQVLNTFEKKSGIDSNNAAMRQSTSKNKREIKSEFIKKELNENAEKNVDGKQNETVKPSMDEGISNRKNVGDFSKDIAEELKNGIYINNAGLVIAASFLPLFFERLLIAKDDSILDFDAAVCLTNFLATGNETMAEFELVLPKILCGLSPDSVINTNIEFNDAWKKEAEDLILSIIEYWSILKNTSVEGLRETFLQREGKLMHENGEWLLQVAPKQFDMLLGQLPWNISIIKLSWMPEMLKTEWAG
ncbi:MAG: contractile injection system tape measure protein [Ferruginibacter sp.]